jgi:glycosyltransferase involved in cell wall biosynthesis
MNILHTVQFYSPSVGGAQEVVRQVSEQLVARGHTVTVATSFHPNRTVNELNGVHIEQFKINGNEVHGYHGEVERYLRFLVEGKFDIMMNYAAQQWSMDLVFPVLARIPYRKVMIPCGFSGLFNPEYRKYFEQMPKRMDQYDHLVFHAGQYRDIQFARQHAIPHLSVIPNGALRAEFEKPDLTFRQRYNIPVDMPLLLTIGSHSGFKGHHLSLEAFRRLETSRAILVIIGNGTGSANIWRNAIRPMLGAVKRREKGRFMGLLRQALRGDFDPGCLPDCRAQAKDINRLCAPRKQVLLLNPPRADVVAAYHAADLFIFGSNVEYSPLVLFEAMASLTPFLSLDCGNAAEIVSWSGGGRIASTIYQPDGPVNADPATFAREIDYLLNHPDERSNLAVQGHAAWLESFTWEKIARQYEEMYEQLLGVPR